MSPSATSLCLVLSSFGCSATRSMGTPELGTPGDLAGAAGSDLSVSPGDDMSRAAAADLTVAVADLSPRPPDLAYTTPGPDRTIPLFAHAPFSLDGDPA